MMPYVPIHVFDVNINAKMNAFDKKQIQIGETYLANGNKYNNAINCRFKTYSSINEYALRTKCNSLEPEFVG